MPGKKVKVKKTLARKTAAKNVNSKPLKSDKEVYRKVVNQVMADILAKIEADNEVKSNGSKFIRLPRLPFTPPKLPHVNFRGPARFKFSLTLFHAWLKFSFTRPAWSLLSFIRLARLKLTFTRPAWSRISLTRPNWSLLSFIRLARLKLTFTRPAWSRISLTRPNWSRLSLTRPARPAPENVGPQNIKSSLPLIVVAAAVALIVAGFWGPQIVRKIGIPIDPEPFTAVYFQDPTIVQTGIVSGDLVVFGVYNGFRDQRNLTWRMESEATTLNRGQVLVNANSDSYVAVSTTGALPGRLLKIYIEGTETPITIQVVG